ncbi:MAG: hypothetical protein RDV41_02605 [Planctomycetota bacterium]|nr:hypothetical protein [Planctomycetota bacterium]
MTGLRSHVLLMFAALLLSAPLNAAPREYTFERKFEKGDVLAVTEEQRTECQYRSEWCGLQGDPAATTAQTGKIIEVKCREYDQETMEVDGKTVSFERIYRKATRENLSPGGKEIKKENTSMHGKTFKIKISDDKFEQKCVNGVLMPDDAGDLKFSENLYALLPEITVKEGELWKVNEEKLGKGLFGPLYDPINFKASATGKVTGTTKHDGEECAKIAYVIEIRTEKSALVPGWKFNLQGEALFAMEKGLLLQVALKGPVEMDKDDGKWVSLKAKGTTLYKYSAKLTRAEPPTTPPDEKGAK